MENKSENNSSEELNNSEEKLKKFKNEVESCLNNEPVTDETRRCLLEIAHSKEQSHAGYLIAITIGTLTLISQWDTFFSLPQKPVSFITTTIFFIIISGIISLTFYILKRTFFWSTYGNSVLNISNVAIIDLFVKHAQEKKYLNLQKQLSPCSCIINGAVGQHMEELRTNKEIHFIRRFSVKEEKEIGILSILLGVLAGEILFFANLLVPYFG